EYFSNRRRQQRKNRCDRERDGGAQNRVQESFAPQVVLTDLRRQPERNGEGHPVEDGFVGPQGIYRLFENILQESPQAGENEHDPDDWGIEFFRENQGRRQREQRELKQCERPLLLDPCRKNAADQNNQQQRREGGRAHANTLREPAAL